MAKIIIKGLIQNVEWAWACAAFPSLQSSRSRLGTISLPTNTKRYRPSRLDLPDSGLRTTAAHPGQILRRKFAWDRLRPLTIITSSSTGLPQSPSVPRRLLTVASDPAATSSIMRAAAPLSKWNLLLTMFFDQLHKMALDVRINLALLIHSAIDL